MKRCGGLLLWLLPPLLGACTGTPDGSLGDAGTCPLEHCDGHDNDCDGHVDEGIAPCPQAAPDADGDGLPDDWELHGVDVDGDGKPELDLAAMGADPMHKDVFVELDWMEQQGAHSDAFDLVALERVQQAFLDAPVDNPDGLSGIHLHIDAGPDSLMDPRDGRRWCEHSRATAVPHRDSLNLEQHAALMREQQGAHRRGVFRYGVAAHAVELLPMPLCPSEDFHANGMAANDQLIVSLAVQEGPLVELGGFRPGSRDPDQQAGLFMHELGHTLGLDHGGADGINRKPNYLSVMNYSFTYRGLTRDGVSGVLDYARFDHAGLDEMRLDEALGLGELGLRGYASLHYCGNPGLVCRERWHELPALQRRSTEGTAAIDWNCNGRIDGEPVAAEINLQGPLGRLQARNDWQHLDYRAGGHVGWLLPGAAAPADTPTCGGELP